MLLVAGLAIAGLAGIAAAFYFSVRPGNSGNSRGRDAGSEHPGAGRSPARSGRSPIHPPRSRRTADQSDPDGDFGDPPGRRADSGHLAAGHRVHRGGFPGQRAPREAPHTAPAGARRAAGPGSQPRRADWPDRDADAPAAAAAQDEAQGSRSRRRVGWRKGSEVDEELWPAESFGGVSDEQFWDDLASDRPLATTARTASAQDAGPRRRLPDIAPARDGDDRARSDSRMASGGPGPGSGAYSPSAGRSGPADRTAIQPVQTGPQRMQTGPHSIQTGSQPVQTGPQQVQAGTQPLPAGTRSYQPGTQAQSYQAASSYQPPTQPAPTMGQSGRAGLPGDARGRGRMANGSDAGAGAGAAASDDPLTSAAYALRSPGAVDGRSQPPRRSRDQYDAALSQETQSFTLADQQAATGGYPAGVPPFRQFDPPAGSGGGNGRAPEPRPDAVRSDPARYDGLRSDPLRTDPLRSDAYWSGGRADPGRGTGTADAYGSAAGLPYAERPYSDPAQPASTPSYGEPYGYGYPVSPADDPRPPNGTRGQGRPGGTGSWAARQAYPTGSGHRAPYDPRTNGRG